MDTVNPGQLESFARTTVEASGAPPETADIVAQSLVSSDLVGHSSHGVVRLPYYVDQIATGSVNPTAMPAIENAGAFYQIDGSGAFGQVTGQQAVELLIETTNERGIGIVGVRNSGHLGRIGEWADSIADEGLLFASWVNLQGGAQRIAPPGTADRRLGTNPLTFAVPTFDTLPFNLVYDGATSQVAHGKIIERDGSKERLPEAWTIRNTGEPVEYAADFEDQIGALLPLGGLEAGHKGFGLATMAELFASIVGNGPVSTEESQEWVGNGAAILAIDPTIFTPEEEISAQIKSLVEHLRSAEPIDNNDEVLLPGETEYLIAQERHKEGIPIEDAVVNNLETVAVQLGIEDVLPESIR